MLYSSLLLSNYYIFLPYRLVTLQSSTNYQYNNKTPNMPPALEVRRHLQIKSQLQVTGKALQKNALLLRLVF